MKSKTTIFNNEDEKILTQWKRTKQIKDSTFKTYKQMITHHTKATGMTLHQLYNEAITEEDNNIPPRRRQIKQHFLELHDYLDSNNMSESTKKLIVTITKSFYQSIDVQIPSIPNNYDNSPDPRNTEKMITPDLIRVMLNNASIRNKAILSMIATTGQSPNELSHITIDDLFRCWNSELETPLFTVEDIFSHKEEILGLPAPPMRIKRLKTNNNYWFYLPSETSRYIIEYIYERHSGRNTKIRINDNSTPLFVTKTGERCTPQVISKVFTSVGRNCGFETPELFDKKTRYLLEREEGKQRVYCAYKYRKYFLNMCRRYAGTRPETDSDNVYQGKELGDFWIGHQEKGSISHYLQYNEDDVRELQEHYLQMLPYLSLEMEVDTVTTRDKQEFNIMKQKYEDMVSEMEELREYVRQKQRLDKLAKEYGLEEI